MTSKKIIKRATILFLICLLYGFSGLSISKYVQHQLQTRRLQKIQSIHQQNDPSTTVFEFTRFLAYKDFELAKGLVAPKQRARLDKWERYSNPSPFSCCNFLSDPDLCDNSFISYSGDEYIDKKIIADSDYWCPGNDAYIEISELIVEYDGAKWVIMGWDKICERPANARVNELCE